jgi:hypothetical protein
MNPSHPFVSQNEAMKGAVACDFLKRFFDKYPTWCSHFVGYDHPIHFQQGAQRDVVYLG